ncbi:MAG: hypothetical protein K1X83_15060 [Oligoflexia bacterium]|nr:hypothetical protein [Oligoflexia bacterium]
MVKAAAQKLVREAQLPEARRDSDTIRLWENYRDQATMWRSIALLQIPATAIALIFALTMWNTRSITLNVPPKPLPGLYAAQDIPDTEFIDSATDFLNLIASYQYNVARRQFEEAAKMLQEPLLSKFKESMLETELRTVESTNRTQLFFVDPTTVKVERPSGTEVIVSLLGDRQKIIAGKEVPLVKSRYTVSLTTIPRNKLNPYGITITDFSFENVEK